MQWFVLCSSHALAALKTHQYQLLPETGEQTTCTTPCHRSYIPRRFYSTGMIMECSYTLSIQKDCILITPWMSDWKLAVSVVLLSFLTLPYCLRLYRSLCDNCKQPKNGNMSWKSKKQMKIWVQDSLAEWILIHSLLILAEASLYWIPNIFLLFFD